MTYCYYLDSAKLDDAQPKVVNRIMRFHEAPGILLAPGSSLVWKDVMDHFHERTPCFIYFLQARG